jgi:hypothetical protein
MFDLEQSIADWRRQMLAAGIKAPMPLEELDNHLREDVAERMRSGVTVQLAFETTVRQIGQGELLQPEFARAGETIYERMKQLFCAFAGIPNYQLATNMNTSNSNPEPGWATYLKNAAVVLPAFFLCIGSMVLVVPKLKEICARSDTVMPQPLLTVLQVSDLIRLNLIWISIAVLVAVVLLEWRARWWPRYRRMVFGVIAYLLNFTALILLSLLTFTAVLAGANLLPHSR